MNHPTPRDLRNAVGLAVAITVIVMFALFDPSCHVARDPTSTAPSRSTSPD